MENFQVKRMFESIAFSYDFQNSFLSLGRDIQWRRTLAKSIDFERGASVLDLATGTAEVAIEICQRHSQARVIGVDFSSTMLAIGRNKIRARHLENRISLLLGDGRRLPVRSASVDCTTMAFGIRNIKERRAVLDELRRVLKKGGQVLIMEFDYPDAPVLGRLYGAYFNHILPPLGNWLSRTNYAYTYLVRSVHEFPTDVEFRDEIAAAGFEQVGIRKLTFGIAKIYSGIKDSS
jgi:demethylmenaquinone methyltransferase/2-methoxy-6-polyprenyl-1,4-benzoquinol methylase